MLQRWKDFSALDNAVNNGKNSKEKSETGWHLFLNVCVTETQLKVVGVPPTKRGHDVQEWQL